MRLVTHEQVNDGTTFDYVLRCEYGAEMKRFVVDSIDVRRHDLEEPAH